MPPQLIGSDCRKLIDSSKAGLVWTFVENNRHIAEYYGPRKINVIFAKRLADTPDHALSIRKLAKQIRHSGNELEAKRIANSGALAQIFRLQRTGLRCLD